MFSHPVAWLLALRPLPVKRELDALVRRLVEAGASRVHLGPLGPEGSLALARDVGLSGTDEHLARQVAAADGNPFYMSAGEHGDTLFVASLGLRPVTRK